MEESIRCQELVAQLSEYIDLELSLEIVDRIERHTTHCSSCRAFKETLRKTVDLVHNRKVPVPPELHNSLMNHLQRCLREAGDTLLQ